MCDCMELGVDVSVYLLEFSENKQKLCSERLSKHKQMFSHTIFKGYSIHFLPSENGSTLKGKNLLPLGANSFLLDSFSEGEWCIGKPTGSHKIYLPCK